MCSILVKGMEMPKTISECRFVEWWDMMCLITGKIIDEEDLGTIHKRRCNGCPLVEVNEDVIKQAVCSKLGINGREYLLPAEKAVIDAVTEVISSN